MLPNSLQTQLAEVRNSHKTIVLVTGVFDLLHEEHIKFLRAAKALGDFLVVGIESDARVRQIKGEGRPIESEQLRAQKLCNTRIPDAVFVLPEKFGDSADHKQLISEILPNYLAVSEHTAHQTEKRILVEEFGGQLKVVLPQNPLVSTTQKIENLKRKKANPR